MQVRCAIFFPLSPWLLLLINTRNFVSLVWVIYGSSWNIYNHSKAGNIYTWKIVNLDSHLYLMTFFHLTKIRCYVLDTFIFLYFIFWMCHWVSNSMMSFSCKIYYVAMVMIKYVKVHFWCFLNPYLSRQKTLFDWYRRS